MIELQIVSNVVLVIVLVVHLIVISDKKRIEYQEEFEDMFPIMSRCEG